MTTETITITKAADSISVARYSAARKTSKVALTAGMCKLLTICNAVIKTNTPWQSPISA